MDTRMIVEKDGFKKLFKKLPLEEKAYIDGMDAAVETLNDIINMVELELEGAERIKEKIELEGSIDTLQDAILEVEDAKRNAMIAFVDRNHYYIDDNGNVVDERLEGKI